jgi:membrane protein implicated in regulation of membrane protease activity
MGRRKKSKEAAVFEALFGLAALVLFALLISPELSPWMQFALALLIVASVVIFVIWFAFKISEPEPHVSSYETLEIISEGVRRRNGPDSVKEPKTAEL